MICEDIQEELVAYCDGELPEEDRARIAAHLSTCSACSRDVVQFTNINTVFTQQVARVALSPDFAATFWQRLEQEKRTAPTRESRFSRWWHEWRESLTNWQFVPALAGAASILVFFSYIVSSRGPETQAPDPGKGDAPRGPKTSTPPPLEIPPLVQEKPGLFVNYRVITDLEKFSRLEEIAAVQLPEETPVGLAESDIPKDLLDKPSFFSNYPMLQKMEELKNLETVLDAPPDGEDKSRG